MLQGVALVQDRGVLEARAKSAEESLAACEAQRNDAVTKLRVKTFLPQTRLVMVAYWRDYNALSSEFLLY